MLSIGAGRRKSPNAPRLATAAAIPPTSNAAFAVVPAESDTTTIVMSVKIAAASTKINSSQSGPRLTTMVVATTAVTQPSKSHTIA
jgi:hypothetical protein